MVARMSEYLQQSPNVSVLMYANAYAWGADLVQYACGAPVGHRRDFARR
jgi:hypothetical protein